MLTIHSFEIVHQEFHKNDVLVLLYDTIKGGLHCVLLPPKWNVDQLIALLPKRVKR